MQNRVVSTHHKRAISPLHLSVPLSTLPSSLPPSLSLPVSKTITLLFFLSLILYLCFLVLHTWIKKLTTDFRCPHFSLLLLLPSISLAVYFYLISFSSPKFSSPYSIRVYIRHSLCYYRRLGAACSKRRGGQFSLHWRRRQKAHSTQRRHCRRSLLFNAWRWKPKDGEKDFWSPNAVINWSVESCPRINTAHLRHSTVYTHSDWPLHSAATS